ncbi:MAG TPA: phage Gp37/Gp68 family protein [Nitrososphaerales archaeon]|nr:phage Gp37/Gp68 family protein [Nitrososphaerales archaeon]
MESLSGLRNARCPELGDKSAIEWTDASWNPTTGCDKVSPGCKNCYAERLAGRLQLMGNPKYKNGFKFTVQESALDLPLKWKEPRKIFVNSMSDLFHEEMPFGYLKRCFDIMKKADRHRYQILTKRPERMQEFAEFYGEIPDHVWMGTSVEMAFYKKRIDILRNIEAKIRFISFEPLLGAIGKVNFRGISWSIVGGESGPGHRPIEKEWVREIRDQCKTQKVAFFFKQWGGATPKSGGRLLDGKLWNQYPEPAPNYTKRTMQPLQLVS